MQDATTDSQLRATAAGLDLIHRALQQPVQVLGSEQKLSTADITQYLTVGGTCCPACLSPDISGGQFDVDQGRAWQHISCGECGLEWDDAYQLVAVHRVEFRKGEEGTVSTSTLNS